MAELKIYGAIGDWAGMLEDYVTAAKVYDFLAENKGKDIAVHINSGGGVVDDGIAIYNALKRHNGKVTVYVDGIAASAASVIAMAGDEVVMYQSSLMMIHNPWTVSVGDASDMRKSADVLDKRRDQLLAAYVAFSGMDEDDIKDLLASETWMSADEALVWGFISRIEGDIEQDYGKMFAGVLLPKCLGVPDKIAAMVGSLPSRVNNNQVPAPVAARVDEVSMSQVEQGAVEVTPGVDVTSVRAMERERIQTIQAKARVLGLDQVQVDEIISMDLPVAESCMAMLDRHAHSAHSAKPITGVNPSATVSADKFDKFASAATGAVLSSAGLRGQDGQNHMRGMSLSDLAREFCAVAGLPVTGTREQVLGRALAWGGAGGHGTADFKQVLKDAANKSMLVSFQEHPTVYQEFCKIGTVQNFQPHHRVGLGTFDSLEYLPEGSEIKAGNINDRGEAIKAEEYGKIVNITRQALVNDSLSVFAELPARMGAAAARTIDNAVLDLILGNPFLVNANRNLFAGTNAGSAALGEIGLIAGRTVMRKQKENGNALNIVPGYLLVPAALEPLAISLMESTVKIGGTNNEPNPVGRMAQVISHARIDQYMDDNGLAQWWALFANPGLIDTVEVAFMGGNAAPRIEFEDQFTLSGTSGRVLFDFAVGALEFRGAYKSQVSA
jgi:ATP-dependent Clp endopeptidase proteolytic subunit ClpP